jgi:bifunctional DNA-binding transcriptional regulator/antitoxin component of YhaV-PrlF toxin-antitoxin module
MDSIQIEFICQTKITEQYEINIPQDAHEFIQECSSEDSIDYFWNYDTRNDTVLISPEKPRMEAIDKLQKTDDHHVGGRTCVPKPVRNKLGFELGDSLYLWTHNKMNQAGAPSVVVWDFSRMENIFLERVETMSEDELFPNF